MRSKHQMVLVPWHPLKSGWLVFDFMYKIKITARNLMFFTLNIIIIYNFVRPGCHFNLILKQLI